MSAARAPSANDSTQRNTANNAKKKGHEVEDVMVEREWVVKLPAGMVSRRSDKAGVSVEEAKVRDGPARTSGDGEAFKSKK